MRLANINSASSCQELPTPQKYFSILELTLAMMSVHSVANLRKGSMKSTKFQVKPEDRHSVPAAEQSILQRLYCLRHKSQLYLFTWFAQKAASRYSWAIVLLTCLSVMTPV